MRESLRRSRVLTHTTAHLLLRLLYRVATMRWRVLPTFFVLGPPRSGTTSLDYYLSQHPSYRSPFMKELGYNPGEAKRPHGELAWLYSQFPGRMRRTVMRAVQGLYFRGGAEGYRKLFPLASDMAKAARITGSAITGDYTVQGLYDADTVDGFPYCTGTDRTKYIVILRTPIECLFSFYTFERHQPAARINRQLPFEDFLRNPGNLYADPGAILAIETKLARWRPLFEGRSYFDESTFSFATAMGCYAVFLKHWASSLSQGQLLVLSFSDLRDHTQETLDTVFDFLEVSPFHVMDIKPKNVGKYKGSTVPPEAAAHLESVLRPYNEELYEFLGRDLGW